MLVKLKTNYRVKTTNGIKNYKIGQKIELKKEEAELLIANGSAEKTKKEVENIEKIEITKNNDSNESWQ